MVFVACGAIAVRGALHLAEIGLAEIVDRRPDTDHDEPERRIVVLADDPDPAVLAAVGEGRLKAGLMDRDPAGLKCGESLWRRFDEGDVVPDGGHADRRDEPDIAAADDGHRL